MKKLASAMVMLSMVTGMLVGCSSGPKTELLDPVTFVFYCADGQEDPWNDPVAKQITRATGVTLDTDFPADGGDDRITLMIASGEYPDIIYAKGESETLIEAGALIDLSQLIEEYGPNIKKLYGEYYDSLRYSSEDPSIYQLCSSKVGGDIVTTSGNAQLQWDVLKENNYEIPYTLYNYESMIKSYLENHPTINGKNTIGISLCCSDWHWYTTLSNPAGYIASGSQDNGQWIIDESTYTAQYKYSCAGQKEFYKWLNQMYAEGILDPEFATQTHEEYLEKIADGRVLGLMDSDWSYQSGERALKSSGQHERTYAGLPVTLNESVKCVALKQTGLSTGWGIGITTACKDPVRAIQFLDYLCSDEGQILLNWGVCGINYFEDENGVRYRTEEEIAASQEDTGYKERTGVGFHIYPFPSYGNNILDETGNTYTLTSSSIVKDEYNEEQQAAVNAWNVEYLTDIFPSSEEFTTSLYPPVWSMYLPLELKTLQSELDSIAWKGLIDCIICQKDEFEQEWASMQTKLEDAGKEKAEQMLTEIIREEVAKIE